MPAPERFAPRSICPRCERFDLHSLRAPRPKPRRGPVRVFPDGSELHRWDGMTGPDESMYEVIRTCRCGHEWGQI